jgi:hypothetical protein
MEKHIYITCLKMEAKGATNAITIINKKLCINRKPIFGF